MKLIRNFFLLITGVFGASAGVILMSLINLIGSIGWSFSKVFLYGLTGGLVAGWIFGLIGLLMIRKWIRKKINHHANGLFNLRFVKMNRFR